MSLHSINTSRTKHGHFASRLFYPCFQRARADFSIVTQRAKALVMGVSGAEGPLVSDVRLLYRYPEANIERYKLHKIIRVFPRLEATPITTYWYDATRC